MAGRGCAAAAGVTGCGGAPPAAGVAGAVAGCCAGTCGVACAGGAPAGAPEAGGATPGRQGGVATSVGAAAADAGACGFAEARTAAGGALVAGFEGDVADVCAPAGLCEWWCRCQRGSFQKEARLQSRYWAMRVAQRGLVFKKRDLPRMPHLCVVMQGHHSFAIQCHRWWCTQTLWNPTTHAVPRGGGAFDECTISRVWGGSRHRLLCKRVGGHLCRRGCASYVRRRWRGHWGALVRHDLPPLQNPSSDPHHGGLSKVNSFASQS